MMDTSPGEDIENEETKGKAKKHSKKIVAYPANWADTFGDSYYHSCAFTEATVPKNENWNVDAAGVAFKETEKNVTSKKQAAENIKKILMEIGVNDG
jgi:hypothetical protein